jgi:hypothetical protein
LPTFNLSGRWSFVLIPDTVYQDTSLIKGFRGSDFEAWSATQEDLFLYQSGSSVTGFSGPLKYTGTVSGNKVTLKVYDQPEGKLKMESPVEEMVHVSDIVLTIHANMTLSGSGSYKENLQYPYMPKDTYKVQSSRFPGYKFTSEASKNSFPNWDLPHRRRWDWRCTSFMPNRATLPYRSSTITTPDR